MTRLARVRYRNREKRSNIGTYQLVSDPPHLLVEVVEFYNLFPRVVFESCDVRVRLAYATEPGCQGSSDLCVPTVQCCQHSKPKPQPQQQVWLLKTKIPVP
eukprot:scaffold7832_cov103-Cylindrotheca_fusiformis.AAC.5